MLCVGGVFEISVRTKKIVGFRIGFTREFSQSAIQPIVDLIIFFKYSKTKIKI